MPRTIETDVAAVAGIAAVPAMLDVICRATGMGFAAVARVTGGRWIACTVKDEIGFGLVRGGELSLQTTICNEIRDSGVGVAIDDVAADPLYCSHPAPAMYGFRSYISMPIVLLDGTFFGTLCAIDPNPARLNNPETIGMFALFAELIAFHLDAAGRIDASEAGLAVAREQAVLREQFVAVLAHDLRNPLAAIDAGARIIARDGVSEKAESVLGEMRKSVRRMARLIDDVLDFARGRLGGGLSLDLVADDHLQEALAQVIAELRAGWPGRQIEAELHLAAVVTCDAAGIGRMLSNLLGNALTHGDADRPVRVRADCAAGGLELSVANAGPPIPPEAMARLFQPFFRADVRPNQQGLGLGLFIAAEIARAHGGTLDVESNAAETRFTFRLPGK